MTPEDFARAMNRKAFVLRAEAMRAEQQTVTDAKAQAEKLSSGTLSTAQLAQMGHPYARRSPTSQNPEVINAQTGLLRSSWVSDGPSLGMGGVITSRVYNTSSEARYMTGTRLMVPRPLVDAVKKAVQPARLRRLRAAVQKAIKA